MEPEEEPIEDARGLLCPLPVIRLGARMAAIPPGGTLRLWADDPAAEEDVRLWAKGHGHTILAVDRDAGWTAIRLRRKG
jgi:TusA-related sulfurtransferase